MTNSPLLVVDSSVVVALPGRFAGWPANNGSFQFREDGSELLVGFTDCPFVSTDTGHNTVDPTDDELKYVLAMRYVVVVGHLRVQKPEVLFFSSREESPPTKWSKSVFSIRFEIEIQQTMPI